MSGFKEFEEKAKDAFSDLKADETFGERLEDEQAEAKDANANASDANASDASDESEEKNESKAEEAKETVAVETSEEAAKREQDAKDDAAEKTAKEQADRITAVGEAGGTEPNRFVLVDGELTHAPVELENHPSAVFVRDAEIAEKDKVPASTVVEPLSDDGLNRRKPGNTVEGLPEVLNDQTPGNTSQAHAPVRKQDDDGTAYIEVDGERHDLKDIRVEEGEEGDR